MIFVALAVLVLAVLVGLGRKPLMARVQGRYAAFGMAALAIAAAAWDAARGGWLGGSILVDRGALAGRRRRAAPVARRVRRHGPGAKPPRCWASAESADRDEIEAAYRRLMLRVHPDQGGAPGLAVQLNAARAAMLAAKGR